MVWHLGTDARCVASNVKAAAAPYPRPVRVSNARNLSILASLCRQGHPKRAAHTGMLSTAESHSSRDNIAQYTASVSARIFLSTRYPRIHDSYIPTAQCYAYTSACEAREFCEVVSQRLSKDCNTHRGGLRSDRSSLDSVRSGELRAPVACSPISMLLWLCKRILDILACGNRCFCFQNKIKYCLDALIRIFF